LPALLACSGPSEQQARFDAAADGPPSRKVVIPASTQASALPDGDQIEDITYRCGLLGWSKCHLEEFVEGARVCALMAVKARKIVLTYPSDSHPDQGHCSGQNGPATRYGIASVTKSITSTLLGFALEDPAISPERRMELADRVAEHLSELDKAHSNGGYDGATIRDLLRMRSGVAFEENGEDGARLRKEVIGGEVPSLDFAARFGASRDGRGVFRYAGLDTQVLGLLIERSTGQQLHDYLRTKLWEPLGMEDPVDWKTDAKDTAAAFCCFEASLRDLAKFGLFVLDKGSWKGRQLLSSAYIAEATRFDEHVAPSSGSYNRHCPLGYQYQWWTFEGESGEATARGRSGQFIHLIPEEDLVIVQISNWRRWMNRAECESYAAHRAIAEAAGQ
jgi:CubicO group peptidase (beta-lactamase class C family)